jgi:hypothetical protein
MDRAADRDRYILERPVIAPPGVCWILDLQWRGYSTAGGLIGHGTGQLWQALAREALLEPLDISRIAWMQAPDGEASAASGLRMTQPDLAPIGMLVLNGGRWNDRTTCRRRQLTGLLHPSHRRSQRPMQRLLFWHLLLGGVELRGSFPVALRRLCRISTRPASEDCYPRRTPQNSGNIAFTMSLMSERNAVG